MDLLRKVKARLARGRRVRNPIPSPSDVFSDMVRATAAKEWLLDWLAVRQELTVQNICNAPKELRDLLVAELRVYRLLEQDLEIAIKRGEDVALALTQKHNEEQEVTSS